MGPKPQKRPSDEAIPDPKRGRTDGSKSLQDDPESPFLGQSTPSNTSLQPPASRLPRGTLTLPAVRFFVANERGEPAVPAMTNLAYAFRGDISKRLLALDTLELKATKDLVNLALVNPSSLELDPTYVTLKGAKEPTRFFFTGLTAHSSLFSGNLARSISFAPSGHTFPRVMALLGPLFNRDALALQAFRGGISVSSYMKKATTHRSPRKLCTAPSSPSKGPKDQIFNWGASVLSWDQDVPTYDGRRGFDLMAFQKLPKITFDELTENTGVIVICTISSYTSDNLVTVKEPNLNRVVSFNIQSVILVANPDPSVNDDIPACEPLGVEFEKELDDVEPEVVREEVWV